MNEEERRQFILDRLKGDYEELPDERELELNKPISPDRKKRKIAAIFSTLNAVYFYQLYKQHLSTSVAVLSWIFIMILGLIGYWIWLGAAKWKDERDD